MTEIRFHGRGGQGTVVASVLLAKAFFNSDYYVQTFPSFGVERRGAPVEAYLRLDNKKILIRSNVYTPDHVVIQDKKLLLLETLDVTKGLKQGGIILINSNEFPENMESYKDYKIAIVDASEIARKHKLGTRTHPIINTAMLGAFSKAFNMPLMQHIATAIKDEIKTKTDANIKAAEDAFNMVRLN